MNCFVQEVLLPSAADDAQRQQSLFIPKMKDRTSQKHSSREDERLFSSKRMRNESKRSREKRSTTRQPRPRTTPSTPDRTLPPDNDSDDDEVIVFKPAFASSTGHTSATATPIDASAKSYLETVHHMNTSAAGSSENIPSLSNENVSDEDVLSEEEEEGIDCSDLLAVYSNGNDRDIFAGNELWDDPTYTDEKQWFTTAGEDDPIEQHMDFDGLLSDEVPVSHTAPPPGFTVEQQVPLWKQYDEWIH